VKIKAAKKLKEAETKLKEVLKDDKIIFRDSENKEKSPKLKSKKSKSPRKNPRKLRT